MYRRYYSLKSSVGGIELERSNLICHSELNGRKTGIHLIAIGSEKSCQMIAKRLGCGMPLPYRTPRGGRRPVPSRDSHCAERLSLPIRIPRRYSPQPDRDSLGGARDLPTRQRNLSDNRAGSRSPLVRADGGSNTAELGWPVPPEAILQRTPGTGPTSTGVQERNGGPDSSS